MTPAQERTGYSPEGAAYEISIKRTASPWSILEGMYTKAGRVYVLRARGSNIAEVYAQQAAQFNAAFIVTACNAHDDLLAALVKLANEVRACLYMTGEPLRSAIGNTNFSVLEQRSKEADAAIAKAQP